MKKALLFAGLLLALTASVAMAAGVSMSWMNYCWRTAPREPDVACNSNANVNIRMDHLLQARTPMPAFVGVGVYGGAGGGRGVPDWWKMGATRRTAVRSSSPVRTLGARQAARRVLRPVAAWAAAAAALGSTAIAASGARAPVGVAPRSARANVEYFAIQFPRLGLQDPEHLQTAACPGDLGPEADHRRGPRDRDLPREPYAGGNQCLTCSLALIAPRSDTQPTWARSRACTGSRSSEASIRGVLRETPPVAFVPPRPRSAASAVPPGLSPRAGLFVSPARAAATSSRGPGRASAVILRSRRPLEEALDRRRASS